MRWERKEIIQIAFYFGSDLAIIRLSCSTEEKWNCLSLTCHIRLHRSPVPNLGKAMLNY